MKAGVVGAGMMGAEIALVFALGGIEVVLNDLHKGRGQPDWIRDGES